MPKEQISCFWKRPAGNRQHLSILEVSSPHEMEGETVICNCHGQEWITNLKSGDPVLVWGPLKKGREGDYLGNACPDAMQPSYGIQDTSTYVQPEIPEPEQQPEQSANQTERRISTKLKGSANIDAFMALAGSCGGHGEAGHLLMVFALMQVQDQVGSLPSHELSDYLRKALQRAGQPV
jgi:hypothetical protein